MKAEGFVNICDVCKHEISESFYNYNLIGDSIDTCIDCFETVDSTVIKEKSLFVDFQKLEDYSILVYSPSMVIIITKPEYLKDTTELFDSIDIGTKIINDKIIKTDCTNYKNYYDKSCYCDCRCNSELHCIAFLNLRSSIYDWVFFAEYKNDDVDQFSVMFIINTNPVSIEYCNIAVVIYDSHGRMGIWNKFGSIDEFKTEYDKFLSKPTLSNKDMEYFEERLIEDIYEKICDDDMLNYISNFGVYYVYKNSMDIN